MSSISFNMLHNLTNNLLFKLLNILKRKIESNYQLFSKIWRWYFLFIKVPIKLLFNNCVLINRNININRNYFFVLSKTSQTKFGSIWALFLSILFCISWNDKGKMIFLRILIRIWLVLRIIRIIFLILRVRRSLSN